MIDIVTQFYDAVVFTTRRYTFEPQQDITAYELARILKLISEQANTSPFSQAVDLPNGLAPALSRHFRIEEK